MAGGFSITISAIDSTTATLDKINARLEKMQKIAKAPFAGVQASVENITRSLAKFSNLTGISKIAGAVSGLAGRFGKLFGVIGKLAGPMAAIFGGGMIALAWKATRAYASYGRTVLMTSAYIGASLQQTQQIRNLSRTLGLGPDTLAQNQHSMAEAFQEAVMNPGGQQAQLLKKFGLNPQGASRFQARNPTPADLTTITEAVARLKGMMNPVNIENMLGQLGISADLAAAIMAGPEELKKAQAKALEIGTQSDETIRLQNEENIKLGVLNGNIEQMTVDVGGVASKALNPLIDGFNDLMNPMKGFGEGLDGLAAKMASLAGGGSGGGGILSSIFDALGIASLIPGGSGLIGKGAGLAARGLAAGAGALGAGGMGAIGGLIGGTLGALWLGSKYETPETQAAREANAKAMRVTSPTGMKTYDQPGSDLNLPEGQDARYAAVRDKLAKDLGISKEAAAGIVSNLHAESGMQGINEKNPTVPGSRGGTGWAQWTGPRRVEFEKYAASMNLDPRSDAANYGFLVQELQSSYPKVLEQLRAGKITAQQAANIFFTGFESGGAPGLEPVRGKHVAMAERIAGMKSSDPASGRAQVDINLNGFPKDVKTTASTYGELLGKPSINMGMASVLG